MTWVAMFTILIPCLYRELKTPTEYAQSQSPSTTGHGAFAVLEQRRPIKDRAVRAGHKLVRHVRAVVEGQPAPPVRRVQREPRVVLQGSEEGVEPIVVSRGTVGDVPRRAGVVELVRIGVGVADGRVALVRVDVAGEDQVDRVVEEDGFEDLAAVFTDGAAFVFGTDVPRAVAGYRRLGRYVSIQVASSYAQESGHHLPTTTQGVLLLSTEARSCCSQFNWASRMLLNGPLSSPSLPPGSSGPMSPCPRSVSVSIWT